MLRHIMAKSTFIAITCSISICTHAVADSPTAIDVPAGELVTALKSLAAQADIELVYQPRQLRNFHTNGLHGNYSAHEAVTLLLKDTPLHVHTDPSGAMVIALPTAATPNEAPQASTDAPEPSKSFWSRLRLAQYDTPSTSRADTPSPSRGEDQGEDEKEAQLRKRIELEEIVVTGTHIRGTGNSSSPLMQYSREDIEKTGLATTEQFTRTLPQNFGGGISNIAGGSVYGGEDSGLNFSAGSGINLRGLGNDSTLVLLNGKRLASAGLGNFVDISLIPLAAIERIDVLTDGASAIYGSDAVGGVVNVILRRDFEGAETYVRYGSVTDGGRHLLQGGQLFGNSWSSGSALISYDYTDTSKLDSRDRSFAASLFDPTDLLLGETKHGVVASLSQAVAAHVRLSGDALFSRRDSERAFVLSNGIPERDDFNAEQYGANVEATIELGSGWQADIGGSYNVSTTDTRFVRAGALSGTADLRITTRSLDAQADGTLFQAPAGAVRLAIGSQYRREAHQSRGTLIPTVGTLSREVYAGFAEVLVPLLQKLELTLAARYEHYDDFGSSTDPKVGLHWSPTSSVSLRGTYGTSFRAPLLPELDDSRPNILPFPFPEGAGPPTPALYVEGNSDSLRPEEATTWTAGIDLTPQSMPGLTAALTYFDVRFEERIASPIVGAAFSTTLTNPAFAPFVTRSPSLEAVNAYYSHPLFRNPFGIAAGSIQAIVDNRLTNISSRDVSGVDLNSAYRIDTGMGEFSASLNLSYLLDLEDRLLPSSAPLSVLNTVYYPSDVRARGGLGWKRDRIGVTAFVNYVDNYHNTAVVPAENIASWTTVDLDVSYRASHDFVFSLSAQNILDRDPPYVRVLTANNVNFDATNSHPLGRFVSLQIRETW